MFLFIWNKRNKGRRNGASTNTKISSKIKAWEAQKHNNHGGLQGRKTRRALGAENEGESVEFGWSTSLLIELIA